MNIVTVDLSSSTSSISGNAPLTLQLNPSGYDVDAGAIIKIEYNFGDNTPNTIVRRKLTVDSPEVSAYAYPSDPGDPRNIIVSHNYFPSVSGNPQVFQLEVSVTAANSFTPTVYTIPVSVYKIDAINGAANGYFNDIHLIGSRVHGIENSKLLVFETVDPRYITFITFDKDIDQSHEIDVELPVMSLEYTDSQTQLTLTTLPTTVTRTDVPNGTPWVLNVQVQNTGAANLTLGTISIDNLTDFYPITQPITTVLIPGNSTTFSVSSVENHNGTVTGVLSIPNNANTLTQINLNISYHFTPAA